ncbi:major capsid protein [Kiloniella laminariae]|uniref:major capsid protein n=1 Tax=Kiloniella laminariae TaxID=454162 RepID=UPI000361F352|nr:major capsid protein [Kiloniella laminariae]
MDIYDIGVLAAVVANLDQPSSFLLDTFAPLEQVEETDEIHFDVDESKPELAPFVSPLVAGKVQRGQGFSTKVFTPAYVKDLRRHDAKRVVKRMIGEKIGGTLSNADRAKMNLKSDLVDQLARLGRREEVMMASVLVSGSVTVVGEDMPTRVVDFGRDPSLTRQLVGALRWGEAGVSPMDDIEDFAGDISEISGVTPNVVVMDANAWKLFRKDPDVIEMIKADASRGGEMLRVGPEARGQGSKKFVHKGKIGTFDIWVGNDIYVNPETKLIERLIPEYGVIVAADGGVDGLMGTRCYGMVHDEEAQYSAMRYFTKSWLEKNPSARMLLLQSAPLVVPYRPNGSGFIRVR